MAPMKAPAGKTVAMTFVSHPVKDARARWAATLSFPADADASAALPVCAEDGLGAPVASGVLELAGAKIAITDGKGALPYADFARGLAETGIWLSRPGLAPVPGSLTFA